jgi:hypothetical protein
MDSQDNLPELRQILVSEFHALFGWKRVLKVSLP